MKYTKYIFILFVFSVIVSGCSKNTSDYDKETIKRAETVAKSYLENNYTDIKSVEIEKVYRGEMGGMEVSGTVNNKYEFGMGINESDFTVGSVGRGKGFPDMKEECKDKSCDY
ncbi:MAG TPA: hypothetical protein VK144_04245 [Bacillota bacterium]|nr:hypothetical protein [Bacillota bacterium]